MVELKAAKRLHPRHYLQLHNALRASTIELGLLLNFGLKPEFKRIILMNHHKPKPEPLTGSIRDFQRLSASARNAIPHSPIEIATRPVTASDGAE